MIKCSPELVIIGAGAAGLCAGMLAARAGMKPLILEAGNQVGRKLAICGGGNANFSNLNIDSKNYLCEPDSLFCKNVLRKFTSLDCIEMIEDAHLSWEEKENGRLFLKVPAIFLVRWFVSEIKKYGAELCLDAKVCKICKEDGFYSIHSDKNTYKTKNIILATGSPARPALAGGSGANLIKALGHTIYPARPALTPLNFSRNFSDKQLFSSLAGISAHCIAAIDRKPVSFKDSLLFTHSGLSGPAILRASLFFERGDNLLINFLPEHDYESMLDDKANSKKTPRQITRKLLAMRLADILLPSRLADRKIAEISRADRHELACAMHGRIFPNLVPGGLKHAEVCAGGVNVLELNPDSLESRMHPGIHIIGEMCAVTGELGGYNLHWAFGGAHAAIRHITQSRCQD